VRSSKTAYANLQWSERGGIAEERGLIDSLEMKRKADTQGGVSTSITALREFDRAKVNLRQPAEDEHGRRRMSSGSLEEITCDLYGSGVGPTAAVAGDFMRIFRQNILVSLWVFVTAVAMIGWLAGLSWAAARMIERLFS